MTLLLKTVTALASLRFLAPGWRLPCFVMLGITAGMACFVFHLSRAASYMSDEPETCMNCHVMTTQYLTWQHSSHARVATCNDCHVPHDNPPFFLRSFVHELLTHPLAEPANKRQLANLTDLAGKLLDFFQRQSWKAEA